MNNLEIIINNYIICFLRLGCCLKYETVDGCLCGKCENYFKLIYQSDFEKYNKDITIDQFEKLEDLSECVTVDGCIDRIKMLIEKGTIREYTEESLNKRIEILKEALEYLEYLRDYSYDYSK